MSTQLFDDGSLDIINNSSGNKKTLDAIEKALLELGEPQKIDEMAEKLQQMNILDDKDIEVLESKGIVHQEKAFELEMQQEQEQEPKQQYQEDIEEEQVQENDDEER